jgi:hypothetical protein
LAAAANHNRSDMDRDGLSDQQELVLGTLPYRMDTDGDTYSDLEELARASDPLDVATMPEPADFGVGTCASQEDGFVSVLSGLYVNQSELDSVEFEFGIVYRGRALRLSPVTYRYTRGFLSDASDALDTLAVLEFGLPAGLVQRLGQVNLYFVMRGTSPTAQDPVVSLVSLVDFSGIIMVVQQQRASISNSGGGQTGVVYRPLAGDDQIPSTWNGGKICFQRTSAVGMNGVSIVHEVGETECMPMDTYCSPEDCDGREGQPLELPDPAALVGG